MSRLTRRQEEVLRAFFRGTERLRLHGVLVDPPAEILANKLCALLYRGEVLDLVDVLYLERSSLSVGDTLGPAPPER